MDTVGSERAAIMVSYDAGPTGMLFATTKPGRTAALILANTAAYFRSIYKADARSLLPAMHDVLAGRLVDMNGGRLIKSTGDGVLATFDGPGRAIRFAHAFRDQLRPLGLEIRVGIHTGELQLRGSDIGGMAVHLAARIMASADPGEILVSRTVKDLVVGSDIALADRGVYQLKGIEGEWPLLAVA